MPITLFKHNEEAYRAALSMLQSTGRAAVVHPTGTGKSFIGFKLCEEHPTATICWLSPSEHILQTQWERLMEATGGWAPENVACLTYAKLMNMGEGELAGLAPDYIILDEFHRCGARMWGQGVGRLLSMHPSAPVLGLSATAIRYLDSQRDMAQELFGGDVASEMTLGEAIARGILSPPKYVLAVFPCQRALDRYQERVANAKSRAARDEAGRCLEELRRSLGQAEGLDVMFERHMGRQDGRYIVFCSSYDHLCEMVGKAGEWFAKVDPEPHIYTVYSEDTGASRAFSDFKRDGSGHLKLLYCIDMLNEGVHVDGVDGVILLRPTVSPIVYRQQIGRAMAAGQGRAAVIFDVVLNIEGLCSIDAVAEEVREAAYYYRSMGLGAEVVSESFQVVSEVRECMALFQRLNDALGASWELMYRQAERYYEENGDLDVPKRYVDAEGYTLGSWLNTQRLVRGGKARGRLGQHRIALLDRLGMRWEGAQDVAWERNYAAARAYYAEHGDLLVGASDRAYQGVRLGRWLAQLRSHWRNGAQGGHLTPERVRLLEEIGMVWDLPDYLWERNFQAAVEYRREHGHLDVPLYYVTGDGVRLGAWLASLRAARRDPGTRRTPLSQEQIQSLNGLGFSWEGKRNVTWEESYAAACAYKREHGSLDIPVGYVTGDGCRLGRWIRRQRDAGRGTLSKGRREKLEALGMEWEAPDPWERKLTLARQYYEEHGNANIPMDYVAEGVWLGRWLAEQRARLNGRPTGRNKEVRGLTEAQEGQLASIGIRKNDSRSARAWESHYDAAKEFYEENGHLRIPKRYASPRDGSLGSWVQRQRAYGRKGELGREQVERLNRIGMVWDVK